MQHRTFADSEYLPVKNNQPCYIIAGVPFDGTSSYRSGSRFAPSSIRDSSYNFEAYLPDTGVDLTDIPLFDAGDVVEAGSVEDMLSLLKIEIEDIFFRFPSALLIFLGGEHSITPGIVKGIAEHADNSGVKSPASKGTEKIGVLYLDAHLDMREDYLGIRDSHACAARRTAEIVGFENIILAGIRSFSAQEAEFLEPMIERDEFRFYSARAVKKKGAAEVGKEAVERLFSSGCTDLYLSIDMDVFDPSEAPAVGNPEPGGLNYYEVMDIIRAAAPYLRGMDLVEVSPDYDRGITALLAAKVIRETIGLHYASSGEFRGAGKGF